MITGTTQVAVVIGDPIAHSRSPALHNPAFAAVGLDAVMVPLRIAAADLVPTVRALHAAGVIGASVTVPHKEAVLDACVEIAPGARRAGAVNCLVRGASGWIGHNTDGAGFLAAVHARGWSVAGKRAVVLGAGGAARAVATALAEEGVFTVVIARRPERARWAGDASGGAPIARAVRPWEAETLASVFADAELVVDTTPVGLVVAGEAEVVDGLPLAALPSTARVVSLVYHRRPLLLERAAARGLEVMDGRAMLVHQGALAFALWTKMAAPLDVMDAALPHAAPSPSPA